MKDQLLASDNKTSLTLKIAVVDSGIEPTHEKIGPVHHVRLESGHFSETDLAGHGTACAGIILDKAPYAQLYSIPIFDQSLCANSQSLIAAIQWCIDNQMDVVNLSLGTTDVTHRDALATICRQARQAGAILVAAQHNDGHESYPAVLPDVIGVTGGKVRGKYSYYYRPDNPIECVARGDAQRVCWSDKPYVMVSGTSFAAPHITGIVARIRQTYPGAPIEQVRQLLKANSLKEEPELLQSRPPRLTTSIPPTDPVDLSWIKNAALYPFNKEMHALVRGLGLLHFDLVGIADPVGKGLVGQDAGAALGLPEIGLRIQPRLSAALENANTLILGYVDQLGRIGKKDLLRESIQTALDHDCHVFSFLAVPRDTYGDLYQLAASKGLQLVYPGLSSEEIHQALSPEAASLSPVDAPVLGVFGTSSQQGKFTLQLALRRHLINRGYKVGQVGTEHHSALFGMDLAFPMGYASNVLLPLQCYVPFLDYCMRQICQLKQPDIILVGSQSGTIPYDVHTHSTHSMTSSAFLLGTKPDACILVVNSIDDPSYIQDTIDGIRALAKAPTLALAMGNQEKHIRSAYGRAFVKPRPLPAEEITSKLRQLEDRFGLPTVEILAPQGQQRLIHTILDYFSEEETTCKKA
ncbi:MAG: S8 family serine peptidase [Candidatus Latescibacteria bacterium]|nr:S8 family serine peptidase [Candidatus Latescibacterota bacterium]